MKIGIIGYGHVGKAMHQLFQDAKIYDKYKKQWYWFRYIIYNWY